MVENQHSVNSILSFGAKSVAPAILEQLLIGRDKIAKQLTHAVDNIVNDGLNQHILVIAQRGMGKTHLIRVVHHRASDYIKKGKIIIAYFSEEEYGVSNYFDFLIRVLNSFQRWNDADRIPLQQRIEELQNTPLNNQTMVAEKIISEYIGKKPLLLLCENFGDILAGIGSTEQGKLRSWLYRNDRISIIATSQSMSEDFESEDRPFFSFFQLIYLKTLTYKDTFNFLVSLAKLEKRKDVVEHLENRGMAQVRAIHDLVKGNHRLLVTFYEFLKSDTLAKLSSHFIKTINDLKPYYETYIRYLPPMQQKVLRFIALSRKPQQGTDISRNCFIEAKTLSKQLSELVKKKLVEAITDPSDKRNRLYDIDEPLLRISIEVGEHKEGITALFVDFLALYYDEKELKTKVNKFTDLMQSCHDIQEKAAFEYEIAAIKRALDLKKTEGNSDRKRILELVKDAIVTKEFSKPIAFAKQVLKKADYNVGFFSDILSNIYLVEGKYEEVVSVLKDLDSEVLVKNDLAGRLGIAILRIAKTSGDESKYPEILSYFELADENSKKSESVLLEWANVLVSHGLALEDNTIIAKGMQKFEEAKANYPNDYELYLGQANAQTTLGLHSDDGSFFKLAFKNFAEAHRLNRKSTTVLRVWGGSLAILSSNFKIDREDVSSFKQALKSLDLQDRIACWKFFAEVAFFELFVFIAAILKDDIKKAPQELSPVMVTWLTNILSNREEPMDLKVAKKVEKLVDEIKAMIPELEIIEKYLTTYIEYNLKDNKNAIFNLPKEQRLFFEKNIAKERESQINNE
ncbi:MAG: hypothetical protein EOO20_07520 [Chryseobacterium sp.]|nr:MAG: hypothetical protein EOO20_07520 [Chryseobacterium sp.]